MEQKKVETAVFAGGCFWCLEAVFERIPGVLAVESGYCGGSTVRPDYATVSSGGTGHAEAVRIEFDPEKIGYDRLLEYFWKMHDPTTKNRQGADVGEQYRSVVFYADEAQREMAAASIRALQESLADPIVTSVEPLGTFWPAEAEHQEYYRKNPAAPYCRFIIVPKLKKAGF